MDERTGVPQELAQALRLELLALARLEEDRAATEAASVPYWKPCPSSVIGHRAAAAVLRVNADSLLAMSG